MLYFADSWLSISVTDWQFECMIYNLNHVNLKNLPTSRQVQLLIDGQFVLSALVGVQINMAIR